MATSIYWPTKVISVPRADMNVIQASPEIRELDLDSFRLDLKALEDDWEGMPFPYTHNHNTEVVLSGLTYARIIEIVNGYTVEFEDGQYAVSCTGANHNLSDVKVANQVSLIINNSAGLIVAGSGVTPQDKLDIADAVMDELLVDHPIEGSLSHGVMYRTFNNRVCIDVVNGSAGTAYPLGISSSPVNNLADAKTIAENYNIRELQLYGNLTVGSGESINDYILQAEQDIDVLVILTAGCTTKNTRFFRTILTGTFDGKSYIETCTLLECFNFKGFIIDAIFMDNISYDNGATPSLIHSSGGGKVSPPIEIDIGDASLNIGGWKGEVKLVGKTGANATVIELLSGQVYIDSTCVAGTIVLKGIGYVVEDNSGAGCTVDTSGLMFNTLARILGLVQENYYLDQTAYSDYNGQKLLTSGRMRIYSAPGSVGTANDVIGTYNITSVWSNDELQTYQVVKQ